MVTKSKTNTTTAAILKFLFDNGIFAWRQNVIAPFDVSKGTFRASSKKGVSDILACVPPTGRLLAIEVKTGKDKIRPEQIGFMESIHHVGGCYMIVEDFESFYEQFLFAKLIPFEDSIVA